MSLKTILEEHDLNEFEMINNIKLNAISDYNLKWIIDLRHVLGAQIENKEIDFDSVSYNTKLLSMYEQVCKYANVCPYDKSYFTDEIKKLSADIHRNNIIVECLTANNQMSEELANFIKEDIKEKKNVIDKIKDFKF